MRALGPSPSAAKLMVPRFGIDSASPTGEPSSPTGSAAAVVAMRAKRARAGGRIRGPERRVGAQLHLLPPARPPRARAEAPLPRGLHSSPGHGELQGTAPASSRQSRRWCGAAAMASTRAGCSASSTAGGAPLPRAPPRQPLYLSSPLAVARHPRRLLPRLAPHLQEGTPCDPATGLLHLDCESVWFLGGILGDWSL